MNDLTHGSWFAGIGGFDAGFEQAGFRTVFHSEIDTFASVILATHWPDVPNLGCIRGVRAGSLHTDVQQGGRFTCPLDAVDATKGGDVSGSLESLLRSATVWTGGFP